MHPDRILTSKTYKSVYTLRDITKNDIFNICVELQNEYLINNLGHHEFEPEPITEGGIRFKSYDGIGYLSPYKSMRFIGNKSWKCVDKNKPWEQYDTEIVMIKHSKINLYLKAHDNAPKWTTEEENIFKKVLSVNGFTFSKKGIIISNNFY